jgi:membrane-associated protease RseP (regulator of RpoE activity)
MYAAGVTNNFAITILAFALLFGPVAGAIAPATGVPVGGVIPGGAADDAGIERGDLITGVAGENVTNESELDAALADAGGTVAVSLADGGTVRVERSPVVTRAVVGGPTGFPANTTIAEINGTPVRTEGALEHALENRSVAVFETANGTERTAPAGAYVTRIVPGGPLANASGAGGEPAVITRVDGERTVGRAALSDALDDTEPDEPVPVELFVAGQPRAVNVTLSENPGDPGTGFLGVSGLQSGVSGLVVDDLGIEAYPAAAYLAAVGGGGSDGGSVSSFIGGIILALFLPFASLLPTGLPYNFPGVVAPVTDFYTVTGPLSALGGTAFLLANVLFWTGWVNLNLGLFNCIPAFPLDGGHLLRSSTETVVARLPISGRRALASAVTTAVSLAMIGALLVMVFAPSLLSG